jgi:hypothetical protein
MALVETILKPHSYGFVFQQREKGNGQVKNRKAMWFEYSLNVITATSIAHLFF